MNHSKNPHNDQWKITTPTTYLSCSDFKFRVIHQGLPVSNDKCSAKEALDAANSMKLTVTHFWNGESGHMFTIDEYLSTAL